MNQEIIEITSELFGTITIVSDTWKSDKDIWEGIGEHLDINIYDVGDGTIQATIYPVKDGAIRTEYIIESLQGDNIEFITS